MPKYKCVAAPKIVEIDSNRGYDSAAKSFADLINAEAVDGWKFYAMENLAIVRKPGCLNGLAWYVLGSEGKYCKCEYADICKRIVCAIW